MGRARLMRVAARALRDSNGPANVRHVTLRMFSPSIETIA